MRWTQNGYPREAIHAFEYDGTDSDIEPAVEDLEVFVQDVLASTPDREQVYVVAHGRGTNVVASYLSDPDAAPNP